MDRKSSHPDTKARNGLIYNELSHISEPAGSKTGHIFSLESSFFQALEDFSKEKKMFFSLPKAFIDYKPPKLHRGSTSWYISYYVKNPGTGKFKLFRVKVNAYRSDREKLAAAKLIMAGLQEKLSLGWNPLISPLAPKSVTPLYDALDTFMAVKRKEMEGQSVQTYASYIKVFKDWLAGIGFDNSRPVTAVTMETARAFVDHLETRTDLSARSFNNYLSFLCSLWEWMKGRGYLTDNLFRDFKRKPKKLLQKHRRLLSPEELTALFSYLRTENPEYLCAVILCYCCFMRPKEIALLRCKDIDLQGQCVNVRAEIAKNDKDSVRTIPDVALPFFRALDLSHSHHFLFGRHDGRAADFSPGPDHLAEKKFSDYWDSRIRPACGFGKDIQFYSLKDTGITCMLEFGIPINLVQEQADHSSVAMTAIYVGKHRRANDQVKGADILPKKKFQRFTAPEPNTKTR